MFSTSASIRISTVMPSSRRSSAAVSKRARASARKVSRNSDELIDAVEDLGQLRRDLTKVRLELAWRRVLEEDDRRDGGAELVLKSAQGARRRAM